MAPATREVLVARTHSVEPVVREVTWPPQRPVRTLNLHQAVARWRPVTQPEVRIGPSVPPAPQ